MLKVVAAFAMRRVSAELGKAEHSRRVIIATLERKHRNCLRCDYWPPAYAGSSDCCRPLKQTALRLVDAPGIAPGSSALQADADLSQLNVQENGGTERTRTVIVFIDSEVHTPYCHGPLIEMGGSIGFEPITVSFTVRCSAN